MKLAGLRDIPGSQNTALGDIVDCQGSYRVVGDMFDLSSPAWICETYHDSLSQTTLSNHDLLSKSHLSRPVIQCPRLYWEASRLGGY